MAAKLHLMYLVFINKIKFEHNETNYLLCKDIYNGVDKNRMGMVTSFS